MSEQYETSRVSHHTNSDVPLMIANAMAATRLTDSTGSGSNPAFLADFDSSHSAPMARSSEAGEKADSSYILLDNYKYLMHSLDQLYG